MAFESSTIMTTADPSMVAGDMETMRPALLELGALDVYMGVALTGPMTGMYALSNRWETLDAWSAAEAAMGARMVPGGDLNETAARYQTVQRVISRDLFEVGNATGRFLNASRYSFSSIPAGGPEHATKGMMEAGANGMRMLLVIAGGEMSGHMIGASYVDSLDTISASMAATATDEQYTANVAEANAKLESRTIFRIL